MTPERWQEINAVFMKAVGLSTDDRQAYLDAVGKDDPTLRVEAQALLESDATDNFLEPGELVRHAAAPDGAAADKNIGRQIGPYEIKRLIGAGGMGNVYLAARVSDYQQQVAVKLIKRGMDTDALVRRFQAEVQFLAALGKHPNIAALYDAGATDDQLPYFVMEYVEGERIDRFCDRRRFNLRQRLELFRQVSAAVQFAHQHTIIHRDIKPSNLLVREDGTPKLIDFGIAKLTSPDREATGDSLTQTGLLPLTPNYASPEQLRGEPLTTASDVYSLGVVLYELLVGRRPYELSTGEPPGMAQYVAEQTLPRPSTRVGKRESISTGGDASTQVEPEAVSQARSTPLHRLRRQLAGDLDTIVLMALRKEPERRYASVEQFSSDIGRYLEGLPVLAQKDTFRYRLGKYVKRNKKPLAAAAVFLLVLIAGAIGSVSGWLTALKARDRAEHQKTLLAQEAGRNQALLTREKKLRKLAEGAQKSATQQAQIARLEAAKADEVADFLIGLFQGADPLGLSGYRFGPPPNEDKVPTAHELLCRGTARIRLELADAPEIQATVMDHLGRTWLSLGSIPDAEPLLKAALDWRRKHLGAEHPDTARSLAAFGMVRYIQGNYDQAVPLLREATTIADKTLGPTHPDAGRIKFFFACVLMESRTPGGWPEAVQTFEQLVASLRPHAKERPRDLAFALTGLAMMRHVQKDFTGVFQCLAEATSLLSSTSESDRVVSALIGAVRAIANWKLGNHKAAQKQTDESIKQFQELLGRDHPAVNYFQVYTARLIYNTGDLDKSEAMLRQGVAVAKRAYGRQPRAARTMKYLAELLLDRDKLEEAESLCQDALSINTKILGPDHRDTKDLQRLLARIQKSRGNTCHQVGCQARLESKVPFPKLDRNSPIWVKVAAIWTCN